MSKVEFEFDVPVTLPDGWKWMPLEDLMDQPKQDIVDGPFGSNLKASEYVEEGIPIARLQNVDRNIFIHKNIKYVTTQKAEELSRHTFKPGDILITKLGDPLGEACIAPASIEHGVIVADLVRVRPAENKVDRRYLTYAINSPLVARQFGKHTKGTTRPRVNLGMIRKLPIPVAPRDMQAGVVAEIEKQFSRLDEAIANLKRVKANLKRYKAAVLKAAVEGRLVETEAERASRECRSYETGAQLLQRILETRRSQWKGKGKCKEPAAPDVTGLPELPEGWVWASAEQICGSVRDGTHDTPAYVDSGVPLITSKNLTEGGIDFENVKLISQQDHADISRRSGVEHGDVLFAMIGTVGNPCEIKTDAQFSIKNVGLFKRNPEHLCSAYLCHWLDSPLLKKWLEPRLKGTTQKFAPLGLLREIPVPYAPLTDQQRIVTEIDRRVSLIRGTESQVDTNLHRAGRMRQALLLSLFTGKWTTRIREQYA
jgi:type I restriction enzyme S subunit